MWRTAERRFFRHVCVRNLFPPFLLGFPSIHSLPEAGSWERQYAPPVLHYGCIMPIPSLQLQKKHLSHAEKQRVCTHLWSPRFVTSITVIVSKTWTAGCWLIVLSVVTCDCCKPMNSCRDWAFSNSGLEVGLPAFQLPMFAKCDALKEIGSTSKESMPFVKSKPPLPTRSLRSLSAAARSTSSLWLHHAGKR